MCLKCFYFVVTHFINAINLSQKRGNGQCDDAMTLCNWLMSVIWDFFSLSTSANYCDCHSNTSDEHIRPNDPRIKNETNEIFIRCLQKKKKMLHHQNTQILCNVQRNTCALQEKYLKCRNNWDIKEILFVILSSYRFTVVMDGLMALTEECQDREKKEQAVN